MSGISAGNPAQPNETECPIPRFWDVGKDNANASLPRAAAALQVPSVYPTASAQRKTSSARNVFHRLALPTSVSISSGMKSG